MSENGEGTPVLHRKGSTVKTKAEKKEQRRDRLQILGIIIQAVLTGILAFFTFKYVEETWELNRLSVEPYLTVQVIDFNNPTWEEAEAKITNATKDNTDPVQKMVDEEELNLLKCRITEEGQHLKFYCIVRNLSPRVASNLGVYIYDQKQNKYLACYGKRDPLGEKTRKQFSAFSDSEYVRTKKDIEKELVGEYGNNAKFAYPFLTRYPRPTSTYHDESVVFLFYRDIHGRVYCYRQTFGYGKRGCLKDTIVDFYNQVDFKKFTIW